MNRSLPDELAPSTGREGGNPPSPAHSPYSNLAPSAAIALAGRRGGFLDFIDWSTGQLPPQTRRAALRLLGKLRRSPESPQVLDGSEADAALLLHALGLAEVTDRGRGLLTLSTPGDAPTPSPTWPRLADSFDRPRLCRDRRGGRGVR